MGDDEREFDARKYTPEDAEVQKVLERQKNPRTDELMEYWCEVCGKKQVLTEAEAFDQGWDYPPFLGMWGIVSPRTCGDPGCGIEKTAYWQLVTTNGEGPLTKEQFETCERIVKEREDHG
jgi:hypothetical protein